MSEQDTKSRKNGAQAPIMEQDRVGAGMARWRRELPDVDCSGKSVVGRLFFLNEVFLAAVERTLAPYGLRYAEFAVLATLRVEGAPYRLSPKALLDTLILTSGGLSNILKRLEARGLVRRLADDKDGRGVIVELTQDGRREVEPAMRDHAETERNLIAALSGSQADAVAKALARLTRAAEQARANGQDGN